MAGTPTLSGAVDDLIEKTQKSTKLITAITENNTTFLNNIREKLTAVKTNLTRLQGMNAGQSAQQIKDLNAQIQQHVQELAANKDALAEQLNQIQALTNERDTCNTNLDGEKQNSAKLSTERQSYQDQLHALIQNQQPILARIAELNTLVDTNMKQLEQFVNTATDPTIVAEIDAANNTINELVEQLNQPQAGGKRKSRKNKKKKSRKSKKNTSRKSKKAKKGIRKSKKKLSI